MLMLYQYFPLLSPFLQGTMEFFKIFSCLSARKFLPKTMPGGLSMDFLDFKLLDPLTGFPLYRV